MNYFELYDIPEALQPDKGLIRQKFYTLSRKYHPDFFAGADSEAQANALEFSSEVNKAFKILGNEDATMKYVLQLHGLLEEEEKYTLRPDFLMEMLELNEQVTEAGTDGDEAAKTSVQQSIANIQNEIYAPVKNIIESYAQGVTTKEELLQVKDYYYKKKYLSRILEGMAG